MPSDVDPKVDYAFQKVFGSEDNAPLLIDLLHAVVQPARLISGLEYIPTESGKAGPEDKLTIGDIKVRDQGNRQFHIVAEQPWRSECHEETAQRSANRNH